MIARGAMGNPWIFRGLHQWEAGRRGEQWRPSITELHDLLHEHMDRYLDWAGERLACTQMRKQLIWYTHGQPGAKELRRRVKDLNEVDDFNRILGDFLDELAKRGANGRRVNPQVDGEECSSPRLAA
jgi:tRNA-dihydrouridine synthase B